jgi:DNA invertase Pin-like site-specific DNA recombinase
MTTTAIGYIRVSTEEQADHGAGLAIQHDAIRAYCAEQGIELAAMYADEGISGKEGLDARIGLGDAIDALHTGTVLVIYRLDRLARDLMMQEALLADAWRTGATVASCSATERVYCHPDNPDDPARTLIRQVLGAVAAYERSVIAQRMRNGRRRKLAAVGYAGGPEPYGWTDDAERQVLADVATMRLAGMPWQLIAAHLNYNGRHKRNGGRWTDREIQRTAARHRERTAANVAAPLALAL